MESSSLRDRGATLPPTDRLGDVDRAKHGAIDESDWMIAGVGEASELAHC
jgi:hypothetical protein